MPYITWFKRIGLTAGAVLLFIPALLSFGESGRTGSDHILLIYSLILGFQCLIFGFFGLLKDIEKLKIGLVAIILSIVGAAFLMTNHTLSLLEKMGEITFDVVYEPELMGLGGMALSFPLGLFLLGLTLIRLHYRQLGILVCFSTACMFFGLLFLPMLHHIGIMLVAISLIIIARKV